MTKNKESPHFLEDSILFSFKYFSSICSYYFDPFSISIMHFIMIDVDNNEENMANIYYTLRDIHIN